MSKDVYEIPDIIYVSERNVPITKTRKGFLKKFYENGVPATYHDKEHKSLQTPGGKFRSVTDLVALTRSRFKKTSINAVLRILRELNREGSLYLVWCTRIKKVVVRPGGANTFISGYSRGSHLNKTGRDGLSPARAYIIATTETGDEDEI